MKKKTKYTYIDVINAGDSALENDNRHSESAWQLWNGVSKYIPEKHKINAAKGLMNALHDNWEEYLPDIMG